MKRTNLIIILLITIMFLNVSCQSSKILTDNENQYQKIIELPNYNEEALFLLTNDWLISILDNPKSVIEYTDEEKGVIIGKINTSTPIGPLNMPVQTNFKIKIEIKDEKARFTLSGMELSVNVNGKYSSSNISDMNYDKFILWADEYIIKDYKTFIENDNNSEW
jgi:hypothetical protein